MNVQEINRDIRLLASDIAFSADYNNFCTGAKSLLLVEGITDERFIKPILKEEVVCKVANKAFCDKQSFERPQILNCKNAIANVVFGLSQIPAILNLPKGLGIEKMKIYGMVDLDFAVPDERVLSGANIFVTDTHDLETLLLSTDHGLLEHLDDCAITSEEAEQALFLAYQLGIIRQALQEIGGVELDLRVIAAGGRANIDYSCFIDGNAINLRKIIEYIANNGEKTISKEKVKKILDKCIKSKTIKKKFNTDFQWEEPIDKFEIEKVDDFWKITNGHDILSILRFLNKDVNEKYSIADSSKLNRKFENDLIKKYNYKTIETTQIYKKMLAAEVVIEV